MTLLEEWRGLAYNTNQSTQEYDKFWNRYFSLEKGIYERLLLEEQPVIGTIPSLSEKYGVKPMMMVGFLDGINDSLKTPNPIETMDETTEVNLDFDHELLYKNMVAAKAEWLWTLPQWNELLTPERQKELYKEQRSSTTIHKAPKIGRNDPCPCGSGKKYKKCCGKNA